MSKHCKIEFSHFYSIFKEVIITIVPRRMFMTNQVASTKIYATFNDLNIC